MQTSGRGRRQRKWLAFEGALFASWVVDEGEHVAHQPLDQVVVGVGLVRLIRHLAPSHEDDILLKWPNDVYVRCRASSSWKKVAGILYEASTKGAMTRIVGGIGVNLSCADVRYAGLDAFGWTGTSADLHRAVHAMLASHYEAPTLSVSLPSWYRGDLGVQAVLEGVDSLGPLFYRNEKADALGLNQEGQLLLAKGDMVVDDPDELMWSNIQFGVEDLR
jgi:biotin-(acetyl-CoA carboxylase) ligase